MDREEVTEFLGQVPLLQCLPGSSIRKIADAVEAKHYESGDYVAREGETVDGLYFILEGEAEVSVPANTEEVNRPDYVLKKYDYFGYGTNGPVHQVNVIALSKLTCLVLPNRYGHLLQPKTIWNADETPENCSLLEQILHLEPLEVDIFRGFTLPEAPTFRQVFGGQFIGQALAAASKTVDCLKAVHSLHAIFLVVGDNNLPILYQVHRVRDGNSFATRRVEAKQKGVVIFTLIASFQVIILGVVIILQIVVLESSLEKLVMYYPTYCLEIIVSIIAVSVEPGTTCTPFRKSVRQYTNLEQINQSVASFIWI